MVVSLSSEVVIGLGCAKLGQDVQRQLAETGAAGAAARALQDKIYEAMRSIEDEEGRAALAREIESVLKVVKVDQVWQDKLINLESPFLFQGAEPSSMGPFDGETLKAESQTVESAKPKNRKSKV